MRRPFGKTVIAPVIAGVLAVSAIAMAGSLGVHGSLQPIRTTQHLRIRGHIRHLFPGQARSFRVHVRNPLDRAVRVTRIRATVRRGRGPAGRCPALVLRIRLWRGHRRVPARATRAFRLHVRLRGRAPDRCYATTWRLHYVARSVGA